MSSRDKTDNIFHAEEVVPPRLFSIVGCASQVKWVTDGISIRGYAIMALASISVRACIRVDD